MAHLIPHVLVAFAVTVVLCFVLGLELHSYRRAQQEPLGFGTTRTLTLVGAAGFVLWLLDADRSHVLYATGLVTVVLWLAIYLVRGRRNPDAGGISGTLLPFLVALFAYLMGPLVLTQPAWLTAAALILVIVALGEKPRIRRLSDAIPISEGVTFAKFLLLAGLVLPLLPDTPIPGLEGITYAKVWIAVVVISAISYAGYLAHTYAFPRAGSLLTGLLGGIYSSTAATVVLARQARSAPALAGLAPAATVLATAMMYLRLWVVILVLGHRAAALRLALPFGVLLAGSVGVAAWLWLRERAGEPTRDDGRPHPGLRHPLDLPIAFLFAFLFVAFAALTQYVTGHFGVTGLHALSFVVGFSDIDPFVLSLLAGHFHVGEDAIISAVLIASGSNNLLKAIYAMVLSRDRRMAPAAGWLILTLLLSAAWVWLA